MNCSNSTHATLATAAAISPEVRKRSDTAGSPVSPHSWCLPRPGLTRASSARIPRTVRCWRIRPPRSRSRSTTRCAPGRESRRFATAAARSSRARTRRRREDARRFRSAAACPTATTPSAGRSSRTTGISSPACSRSASAPAGRRRSPVWRAEATGPSTESVGARWLFFAGVLGAAGMALFTFVVRPRDEERIPLIVSTAGVLAALGAAQEIHRVGLSTRDGKALGVGFVIALVVATLGAAATLDRRALRPALWVALPLAAVPAFAGHALDRGLPRVNVVADVLHVLSGLRLGRRAHRGRCRPRRGPATGGRARARVRRAARRHRHHARGRTS